MRAHFNPRITTVGRYEDSVSEDEIKYEPMLFGASLEFALSNSGQLTKNVIKSLLEKVDITTDLNIVIDTRVTMTMVGAYPSIPGWHCDDVQRTSNNAQPDLSLNSPDVRHFMVLLSETNDQSCTEFVSEPFECEIDESRVWSSLHQAVVSSSPKTRFIKQAEIIEFDQNSIHRASATKNAGWRYFFRLSLTPRVPKNEIRKQVQVYMSESNGW